MTARSVMIQGTGSDVGKSMVVAGLCRAFTQRGLVVRPFKPQNMSNNAAVTPDRGEIGRAQALQARACRTPPSIHMNPVLLKPQSEIGSQVIVHGRMCGSVRAREFQAWKPKLLTSVLESFHRLKAEADLVIVEGAGSASEVNLRENDIANMGFARAADVPVVLLGDIDRGGVIAQIVGTKVVIDPEDARMVGGFLVNKFRGDASLFAPGMTLIEERTGWPALGQIPFFPDARRLPAEDAMALQARRHDPASRAGISIAIPVLPHIANFDEFDALKQEPDVNLIMVERDTPIPICDLIILPGSKATIADLAALRRYGWDIDIRAHARRGGFVLGVCGGFQMLGASIADPSGLEGPAGACEGLALLDVETVLGGTKTLRSVVGRSCDDGVSFDGYEMHVGETRGPDTQRPLLRFADGVTDGAMSPSGRVAGAYVHGLFASTIQRAAWIARLGGVSSGLDHDQVVEDTLDRLACHLAEAIDLDRLLSLAR